jgi:hypothetical protein
MRTKRYKRYTRKKKTVKRRKQQRKHMQKYKGGNSSVALDNINQIPASRYIPYSGGEIYGAFNYPQQAKGVMTPIKGGKKRRSLKRKSIKQKGYKGGDVTAIIPQQLVNTGRGVTSFVMDKYNGYSGNPSQSSYLPYVQPIEHISSTELIDLY